VVVDEWCEGNEKTDRRFSTKYIVKPSPPPRRLRFYVKRHRRAAVP